MLFFNDWARVLNVRMQDLFMQSYNKIFCLLVLLSLVEKLI